MKKLFNLFTSLFFISSVCLAQLPVKYDDSYKTIFAKDFCKMMRENPDIVLLDVRSPGEFADTSRYTSLNIGHLKGAINMEIDAITKNKEEFTQKYKDKTLILYCSHSQRSRRVGKFLSENGFTNFYNLNGGMSVLNQMDDEDFPCKDSWVINDVGYKNLSYDKAVDLLKKEKGLVVIDVRSSTQFNSKDSLAENNIGRIKGALNVPYADIKNRIEGLKSYKDSPVLIYTVTGDGDAAREAKVLLANGFTKVYHLVGGLNGLIADQEKLSFLENPPPFQIMDAVKTLNLLKTTPNLAIYDTRTKAEFDNKDEKFYRNLGRIKNAVNVEEKDFERFQLPVDKKTPVFVYGHGEAFKFAQMATAKGYKKVYLLPGMYELISSSFNVEACKDAKEFLVNHEGLY